MSCRCKFRRPKGKGRCKAYAVNGSPYCVFHEPSMKARTQEGRRAGGRTRNQPGTLPRTTPDLELKTSADVAKLLALTINQVRRGELGVNVGNALGVLSGHLIRALEGGELEQRLQRLEGRAGQQARAANANGRSRR